MTKVGTLLTIKCLVNVKEFYIILVNGACGSVVG
jgi:hypothetical protein